MARPLRTTTADDIHSLEKAVDMLKTARTYLRLARASRARGYVARALKSAQGALNHAQRAVGARRG